MSGRFRGGADEMHNYQIDIIVEFLWALSSDGWSSDGVGFAVRQTKRQNRAKVSLNLSKSNNLCALQMWKQRLRPLLNKCPFWLDFRDYDDDNNKYKENRKGRAHKKIKILTILTLDGRLLKLTVTTMVLCRESASRLDLQEAHFGGSPFYSMLSMCDTSANLWTFCPEVAAGARLSGSVS